MFYASIPFFLSAWMVAAMKIILFKMCCNYHNWTPEIDVIIITEQSLYDFPNENWILMTLKNLDTLLWKGIWQSRRKLVTNNFYLQNNIFLNVPILNRTEKFFDGKSVVLRHRSGLCCSTEMIDWKNIPYLPIGCWECFSIWQSSVDLVMTSLLSLLLTLLPLSLGSLTLRPPAALRWLLRGSACDITAGCIVSTSRGVVILTTPRGRQWSNNPLSN